MIEKKSRLAIAGSLIWIVVATFSVLGTHPSIDENAGEAQPEFELITAPAAAEVMVAPLVTLPSEC